MTKSELIDMLATHRQVPRQIAEEVVNIFFDEMQRTLYAGGRIEIRGFGSFQVRHYDGYTGRNPRTHKVIHVPPKRLPVFKPSKLLMERLNEHLEGETPQ